MANPYTVLGVPKSADEKAIKSAFRRLAKQFHPDQNPDDKKAQSRFAEVNQAYEILGDKEKRAQFDRGEIDETGKPKFAGFGGGGEDPFAGFRQAGNGQAAGGQGFGGAEDLLNELFGSAFGGRPGGARGGFSAFDFAGGAGPRPRAKPVSLDVDLVATASLEDMMRGKVRVALPNGKQVSVSIPPEAVDGQVIRLKGKGKSASGRTQGDAMVTLNVRQHPDFRIEGANLTCQFELPLETAISGGKAAVSTPDGKLALTIPAGTSSGRVFRLKGRGLPKKGGGTGDLLASATIILPEDESMLQQLADVLKGSKVS